MSTPVPYASLDDTDLVNRARKGEERAVSVLVRRHHDIVYRVVLGIVGDVDLAADTAQNTFVKALGALDRFRGDSAFRTWLLSIATNEARGLLRTRARRREDPMEGRAPVRDGRPDPSQEAVRRDEDARARRCLDELPEKQRMAVQLRVDHGLSFREVGELIGSSEGAARVNYHHGIRKLRAMLGGRSP